MSRRIAIIGAGPSGMAQLRAFASAAAQQAEIPEIVCFEKQSDWGGQWNYTWRTGLDEHSEPVHSSMYRHLWSNGPKECLEFADYTFDEHFGRPISSYPPRAVLWDYINGRVHHAELVPGRLLKDAVRFSTAVRQVSSHSERGYLLTSEHLPTGQQSTEHFDAVVVACGHFSYPHIPAFEGIKTFPGPVTHAHDFRGAESLAGKDVLIIGGSYSAEDIGIQAHKLGAASVTFSVRTQPMGFGWPDTLQEWPLVERFTGSTTHFLDGRTRSFDAVVLATGYRHHFPFLAPELRLVTANTLYPDGLYKGVVFEGARDLYFLGMQDQWFTFNMFDAQAWFVRDLILQRAVLPDPQSQRRDIQTWLTRLKSVQSVREDVQFQADYIADLIELTDYPSFDLDTVVETFLAWKQDKKENILTYRDRCYRSVMTGTLAAPHHTPWMEAFDDSVEEYLREDSSPRYSALSSLTRQ
ncbi:NAD(P)/FAD-dependent oxidoreductase [Nesterenkonia flava]|uniref:NAD(P)/FAD-dependent oxidoreductase n=1 Tax=Nesterenkonia flava TaxID=469799 RepID=A0ABU1FVU4_9MICC|nr:NAD(P)/FAD-dependent oxidoreductase [Nesterenkonia flava]MDR5712271.1 NAD(P)/FAD-dependent oxidoreductase [Nesterenkonia flava]